MQKGNTFRYLTSGGRIIKDNVTLDRIRSLRIPPAWTDVRISPHPSSRIQATGIDARGRMQYIYNGRWRQKREREKFEKVLEFGRKIPEIRRAARRDLRRKGLPKEKVLAAVVILLERTLIRVGNEEYAKHNHSYGLTTFRDRHARIKGEDLSFTFIGKSGRRHRVDIHDRRLAGVVKRCRDLPGRILFQYLDDKGAVQRVTSCDVNGYLHGIAGARYSAKDFRTWAGTAVAAAALVSFEPCASKTHARRNIVKAMQVVSKRLGNTPAICKKSYVHPMVLESYLNGSIRSTVARLRSVCRARIA